MFPVLFIHAEGSDSSGKLAENQCSGIMLPLQGNKIFKVYNVHF